MSVDALLFWGRIVFLIGLYLFLMYVIFNLTRDLRSRSVSEEEAAPGELVLVEPAETGYRANDAFPLQSETLVGRAPDNTIALPDETVSGHHARMIYRKGAWEVEDLDSRNGVFVNSRKIRAARVNYGDTVQFGGVAVKLVRAGGQVEVPAPPVAIGGRRRARRG